MIEFRKKRVTVRLRDPRQGFAEVCQELELREDPLTGRRCRINVQRAERPKQAPSGEFKLPEAKDCPFCSANIPKVTPMFAFGMPERVVLGESVVFPNLYPFGGFHAVGVFSRRHELELDEFTPEIIENCFRACLRALALASERQPELRYWYLNWNHLQPAGASIVHPHLQVLADGAPSVHLGQLLEQSREFHEHYGRNYWAELVSAEKGAGERYIGASGGVHWLASFAPMESMEVIAIFEGACSLSELGEGLSDFCRGLSRVLKGYKALGVGSFNLSSFSAPRGERLEFYSLNFRLIARPPLGQLYTSDSGFMERLHLEPVVDTLPERLAEELRSHF